MFPFPSATFEGAAVECAPAAACPICGGWFCESRGHLRCMRCHFVLCPSCENEPPPPVECDGAE
jgi:hypothetical protein